MVGIPYTQEAYQLLHEGAIALAQVESNGIRVDMDYLAKAIRRTKRRIDHLKGKLQESDVVKAWRREYKGRTNLGSNDQLGHVLFDVMGFESAGKTSSENPKHKTDEKSLGTVDHPFIKDFLKIKKLERALNTNLKGIRREVVDGFVHPFFNLDTVQTFRSSSDSPNFQNVPKYNPQIGKLTRQAFIARPGRRLVELDYSQLEVAIAVCYHHDPTMMEYLEDKSKDMHRDMAMECYILPIEELQPADKKNPGEVKRASDIRFCGKSGFVFPNFYGDWYIDCAANLWEYISTMNLRRRDGTSLYDHLRSEGITELGDLDPSEKPRIGTFERHIQRVEKAFWSERFPVYDRWRKDWVDEYREKGWMKTLTGFICQGWMKRNEIINYPVQGSAFHCLLWSLIRLQKELKKARMKSLVIGQIHDSVLGDVPDEELDDFLSLARWVMVDELKDAWKWITAPIEIEAEATPIGGNWYQKKEWKIAA